MDGTHVTDVWKDRFSAISYCCHFDLFDNVKEGLLYVMEVPEESVRYETSEYLIEYNANGNYNYGCNTCEWWREHDFMWEEEGE